MNKRRTYKRKNYWGAFILDTFKYLQDKDLTGSDYKVFFYLLENMNTDENKVYRMQKEIAASLEMDKSNISKSIKRLSEKQFITKADNGFMINPHLFYVGKTPTERNSLRFKFDGCLSKKGITIKFSLEEDFYELDITQEYMEKMTDQT